MLLFGRFLILFLQRKLQAARNRKTAVKKISADDVDYSSGYAQFLFVTTHTLLHTHKYNAHIMSPKDTLLPTHTFFFVCASGKSTEVLKFCNLLIFLVFSFLPLTLPHYIRQEH